MFKYALAALTFLTACGSIDFDALPEEGRFEGSVLVMWVGENTTNSGDGKFVFVPTPGDPLRFIRQSGIQNATVSVIEPGIMYTDGGSIPRQIQLFNGFSPWGYAPAYMVHDWLFVARHCLTDNDATSQEAVIADMPFIESAQIIGEAIKALVRAEQVQQNDIAPAAISSAVAGPISRQSWTATGRCDGDRVSKAHHKQIKAALAPRPKAARIGERRSGVTQPRSGVKPARIVQRISF